MIGRQEARNARRSVIPFPKYRRFQVAAYRVGQSRHTIHGLIEVDVTRARAILRDYKARMGEGSLSFTAFLAACMAKATSEHKDVQALHRGARKLVVYDDVDVYTVVEHDLDGEKYVIPYIIRAANRKSLAELHNEIRAAQATDPTDAMQRGFTGRLPTLLYRPFLWAFMALGWWYPRLWKTFVGTVGISSVGMFVHDGGWGIPAAAPTPLSVTVGGIGQKLALVEGKVTVRDSLYLTISVDHDLVDGAPAARFTQRLKDLIESAYGLEALAEESEAPPQIAAAASAPTRL